MGSLQACCLGFLQLPWLCALLHSGAIGSSGKEQLAEHTSLGCQQHSLLPCPPPQSFLLLWLMLMLSASCKLLKGRNDTRPVSLLLSHVRQAWHPQGGEQSAAPGETHGSMPQLLKPQSSAAGLGQVEEESRPPLRARKRSVLSPVQAGLEPAHSHVPIVHKPVAVQRTWAPRPHSAEVVS